MINVIGSFRTYLEIIQFTLTLGIKLEEYGEHYCNAFQPTFNEHGFCYTFKFVTETIYLDLFPPRGEAAGRLL